MGYLPVVFIADYNFYLPTVVALTSLLETKKDNSEYLIYIVNIGFSEEQKNMMDDMSKKYSTQIIFLDIEDEYIKNKYKSLSEHNCSASPAALLKFDLADLCSREDFILYLDGDIIVKEDLSELGSVDFSDDKYVMAVMDTGSLYSRNLINQKIENYFNSGVMLLNLKAMREKGLSEVLIEEKIKSSDNSLMDQHILNKVFKDNKEMLPHIYNVLFVNLIRAKYFYGLKIETINERLNSEYSDWDDMLKKAKIIHYSSFDKPWKYSDVTAVEIWDKYFRLSPVSKDSLHRKKLHIKLINEMRRHKLTALLGSFIWEVETKGIRKAFSDAKRYIKKG